MRSVGVYEDFGVRPIINASGSVTRLGGAPMSAETLEAMTAAALQCVSLEDLQAAASRNISARTKTEAALVTTGAAAALTLGSAAILARLDLGRMEQLPRVLDGRCEIVVSREQRNGYDHAVRAAGGTLVEIGFNEIVANAGVRRPEPWEYAAAIHEKTAAVLYVFSPHSAPPLAEVVRVAHERGVPVLVDAAGELPPCHQLHSIAATGADLIAFSGGKAIRGPQSTGILCGRRELIASAALQMLDMDDHFSLWEPPTDWIDKRILPGIPRHGIGRGFKASKEQIIGLLAALAQFTPERCREHAEKCLGHLQQIERALRDLPVTCTILAGTTAEILPKMHVRLENSTDALDACRRLRHGEPGVYVGHALLAEQTLVINPMHLNEQDTQLLIGRLRAEIMRT